MRFKFNALVILAASILIGQLAVNGATLPKKDKKKKGKVEALSSANEGDSIKKAAKEIPAISKFIKADAKVHKGLFNVYEQDDKYFVEVPDNILSKDILVFVSLVQGSAQIERSSRDFLGYAGDALYSTVVRFERGPQNKLFLKEPVYSVIASDTLSDLYKAIKASSLTPIVAGFDVKAKGQNSVLVDFTEIYNGDHSYFSLKGAKEQMNIGNFQADKSYPTTISAFPTNVIFRSIKSYSEGKVPETRPGTPKARVNATIWEVASSWCLLPEKPMSMRLADERVGYFAQGIIDYDKNPTAAVRQSVACRWRLEPKPEDVERYQRGELVEPIKPIVFYVDRNAPKYLHQYIINGIQEWQKSFEKIGFKNAIIGKLTPTKEEDPDFSIEDARYSVVSYKASPIPNAYGPHISDPRSGEILCSHVALFHNVLDLAQNWYFTQCSPNDPRVRQFPLDQNIMGELMQYIVAHEIGHTLGLRHNFAGSWTYSVSEIRNKDFVKKYSHGSTIMDYMRFNYVAQPEDGIDTKDLIPKISFYDNFAIEWGYKYLPKYNNMYDEQDYLKQWVSTKRKENPRVYFGTERDSSDPRFQAEDLGENNMVANELGIRNLKLVMNNLETWTKGDDEDYTLLRNMYNSVTGQYGRYIMHVLKNIGGRYADTNIKSEGVVGYKPVPKQTQKEALAFLKRNLFNDVPWLLDGKVPTMLQVDKERFLRNVYGNILAASFKNAGNLNDHESILGADAYSFKNFADDLHSTIITEKMKLNKLPLYARILQSEYTTKLIAAAYSTKTPDELTTFISLMDRVYNESKAKLPLTTDAVTKNHLAGLIAAIDLWRSDDQRSLLK